MINDNNGDGGRMSTFTPTEKEIESYSRPEFPSENVLVPKSITLLESDKWEMETIAELLMSGGLKISVSEMIRLCIGESWEDKVKPKLCRIVGIDAPSFKSK